MGIKLRCDTRFQHAFTACSCVFKVITLVWANQRNFFKNATTCSKRMRKTLVATQLQMTILEWKCYYQQSFLPPHFFLPFCLQKQRWIKFFFVLQKGWITTTIVFLIEQLTLCTLRCCGVFFHSRWTRKWSQMQKGWTWMIKSFWVLEHENF